jgi:AGZA family xanthine/uracil permease-like MFS transporter
MGLFARLPIGLAPGMGENFFFVTVVGALVARNFASPWQTAMGVVLISGVLFLLLTVLGVRDALLKMMSQSLRSSVAVGIGVFIAFIGLQKGRLVVDAPSLVTLNAKGLLTADSAVFWIGMAVTAVAVVRRIPGGILLGIAGAAIAAVFFRKLQFQGVIGLPHIENPAAFRFDLRGALSLTCLPFIVVFLFMAVFDALGTLVGVVQQAGLMQDGKIPRLREAMLVDAGGTVLGAMLGTSTVTCYIESAAGVQAGGRTGLVAVVVGLLFLLALVFSPLIIAVGGYAPVTAPALVVVGAMMFGSVRHIDWSDETEVIPAFLVALGIPFFFSIADGLALGFIAWPLLKLVRGKWREVSWLMYVMAAVLVLYFVLVRVQV